MAEFWVAAAVVTAGVVGAAGAAYAGSEEASGEEQAAQTEAAEQQTIQGIEAPYTTAGYGATNALNYLLGTGTVGGTAGAGATQTTLPGADQVGASTGLPAGYLTEQFNPTQAQLESYPGYQFQLAQGDQAVENAASATGGAMGGAALKQLSTFNQGLAASNYQNYFNQFQTQQNNIYDRLTGIAQTGQAAGAQTAATSAQLGTAQAQAGAAAAASQAGGTVGAANALGGSANTLAGLMYLGSIGGGSAGAEAAYNSSYSTGQDILSNLTVDTP